MEVRTKTEIYEVPNMRFLLAFLQEFMAEKQLLSNALSRNEQ